MKQISALLVLFVFLFTSCNNGQTSSSGNLDWNGNLEKAIEQANQQPSMNNEDLAAILKISRKTLHHHFEQYLGLSPSQFRRINRFRKSIKEKQEKKDAGSLTELAYSLDYFDQSHMIREIRSMTGFIPKDFYKNIKQFEDTSITWIIQ